MYGWLKLCLTTALILAAGCAKKSPIGAQDIPGDRITGAGLYVDINPRYSHDGKQIAFLRQTPDRKIQLHLSDSKLHRPVSLMASELLCPDRPYSATLARYNSPDTLAWSPDDRRIAFERIEWFTFDDGERLPGTGLWTFDLISGRVQPLAIHIEHYKSQFYYYHFASWSPDGRYIAFEGEGINGQRVIFTRPMFNSEARGTLPRFDNYEDSDWPTWNPVLSKPEGSPSLCYRQSIFHPMAAPPTDSIRLLSPGKTSETHSELWRWSPRNGQSKKSLSLRPGHFSWEKSGQRLAFTLTPDPIDYNKYEIWVIDRRTLKSKRVSPADGRGYLAPVWIDDSYLGALRPRKDSYDVVTINIRSGHTKLLGSLPTSDCDWSPDRKHVVYAQPRSSGRPDLSEPTTLRILETNLEDK